MSLSTEEIMQLALAGLDDVPADSASYHSGENLRMPP